MLSKYLPCILLILVNLLYLFTHGVSSIRYETQLLLPNLAFFGLVTVIVFFKVSHFLYYELLPRQTKHKKSLRAKISQLTYYFNLFCACFASGNQRPLAKFYCLLACWTIVSYLIPPFLLSLILALLYEWYDIAVHQSLQRLYEQVDPYIDMFLQFVPRYDHRYEF